ncbi:aminopeptidase P family protein [Phormidium sp. FACHB-592]|uniref:Xaa-Pro aminopeptidase n=1 Tax=Stenomitos frigidus AS-A4 TaxID=2933935 RepID=A0ABV0KEU2_9CYAN|nr:aminopeptidase P family protein [Phormidium sp. FACHB-592]MBD2077547.1 aminopeptidase P family protein [Phormidium sp. FACHB-592]
MQTLDRNPSLIAALQTRRTKLAALVNVPVLLWSGSSSPRNFRANTFPFRASSHFLYFAGLPLENAAICLDSGKLVLFMDEASPGSALWHGESPTRDEIAAAIGAYDAYPLAELDSQSEMATIAVQDATTRSHQARVLKRAIASADDSQGFDLALAQAIVSLRTTHDDFALAELRKAATVSIAAHKAGMAATPYARTEAAVRAAMESVIIANNMTCAYTSIVTVHGEVLHNNQYHHPMQPGDLLLADVGAEAASGWASDITRTWAVAGKFSPAQRAIYDVVLAAHDACIAAIRPGVEYRELHLLAARTIAAGLVDLGILRGQVDNLVEQDAHALFFPHGVGHLLGLDVHDMEDLGDLAGYETGRVRSDRFGLNYLRLDRPLQTGMVVTIEPGFYQVPAILQDLERRSRYQAVVDWDRLAQFADVRGIRIEDDVLVTATGSEVLTAALPTKAEAIEQLVQS